MPRWRAHDTCWFNVHTSKPSKGEFHRYMGNGKAKVLLYNYGTRIVPIKALERTR